jgi:hypothetical protein
MIKYFLIIIILFCSNLLFSFDYLKYKDSSFDELINFFELEMSDHINDPDDVPVKLSFFRSFITLEFELPSYPMKTDKKYITNLIYYNKTYYHYKNFENMYNYMINYTYKDYNFVILFQNPLIFYLSKEVGINEKIYLYSFFPIIDRKTKEIYILVNDFQKD